MTEITAADAIRLAKESIANRDHDTLKELLEAFNIDYLEPSIAYTLLAELLDTAIDNENREAVFILLDAYRLQEDRYTLPIEIELFRRNEIPVETLAYIADLYGLNFSGVCNAIMEIDGGPETILGMVRALEVFGPQEDVTLEGLEQRSEQLENPFAGDLIREWRTSTLQPRGKPTWVRDYRNRTPGSVTIPIAMNSGEALLQQVAAETVDEKKDTGTLPYDHLPDDPTPEELLTAEDTLIEGTDLNFRELALAGFRTSLARDVDLFRWMGPAHPITGDNLANPDSISPECQIYGGCRMFYCLHHDCYDDDEAPKDDWFTGNCRYCQRPIEHRWYSVRRPMPNGGWSGCYDTWECVIQHIQDLETFDEVTPQFQIDLVNTFEELVSKIGIQDRREPPRPDEEPQPYEAVDIACPVSSE